MGGVSSTKHIRGNCPLICLFSYACNKCGKAFVEKEDIIQHCVEDHKDSVCVHIFKITFNL